MCMTGLPLPALVIPFSTRPGLYGLIYTPRALVSSTPPAIYDLGFSLSLFLRLSLSLCPRLCLSLLGRTGRVPDWLLDKYFQMDLTLLSLSIKVFEFEFSVSVSVCVCLPVCQSVCLSICPSVCLSVCLSLSLSLSRVGSLQGWSQAIVTDCNPKVYELGSTGVHSVKCFGRRLTQCMPTYEDDGWWRWRWWRWSAYFPSKSYQTGRQQDRLQA